MKYYHASAHTYEFPSYEELIKNRTNHANGNMGLWFAVKSDWITGFGGNVYEVEIDENNISIIPFDECVKWEKNSSKDSEEAACLYYQNLRKEMMTTHKAILFQELSGELAMGIVLDFSVIKDFKKVVKNKLKI
jgi:hypothetical protein